LGAFTNNSCCALDGCDVAKEFEDKIDGCETEYSFSHEYQEKYNSINWKPSNESTSEPMWEYKTQSELYERPFWADLATYRGGGYVLKLSKKMDEALKQIKEINQTLWIDGETRAVFVEFALFYPGKNLHCIITILFECPASGGCTATSQIQATRLDELIGNYRIFVLACELVFVLSIAIFTYKTVKDIVRQGAKFWYQFWNWIELFIIGIGWTCLAFYILRFIANKWTKAKFNENPSSFVSFRYVATADELYGVVVAFLVFLTSVKFVRLFRFNRRMSLLGSTLKYAAWDMFNFFILFTVAFVACVSIAYLLFQTNMDMFSSILSTTETLLNIILGKFKYMNLSHDTFLASAVVLAVYCVVVVFILMNVFLVILNDAFKVVKGDNDLQENEYEIVDYMTTRFKSWLGFRVRPSPMVSDFENEYGFKPTYVPPVKKKYQVPATAILDRKLQELLDFVDKQADRDVMENMHVDQFEDDASKKKALLLLMS
jgi:polycystin 1L2